MDFSYKYASYCVKNADISYIKCGMEAKKHEKYDSVDKDGRFRTAESTSADVTISAGAPVADGGESAEE